MTLLQTVALAAVKVGLAEITDAPVSGAVAIPEGESARYVKLPVPVRVFGITAFNRVYRWVWQQFPYREQRIIDLAVPVAATEATVKLPYELDVVRAVFSVDRALYPLHETTEIRQGETWRLAPASQPLRYVSLPDGVDELNRAVRRIKLVPPSAQDVTLYVSGLRRFAEIGPDDEPVLTRCANALFDYLVAEMYEFDDQHERAGPERQKAAQELQAAINWQETIEDTDTAATPLESFFGD